MRKLHILWAFSWGMGGLDVSNAVLGRYAAQHESMFDLYFAQHEIGTQTINAGGLGPDFWVCRHRHRGEYLDSAEVIDQFLLQYPLDPNWTTIYVLCHEEHWNGLRMMICSKGFRDVRRIPLYVPYADETSLQWYTKGPLRTTLGKVVHGARSFIKGDLDPIQLLKKC